MAGRSKEAERQNVALKNILDGKPAEKRSMVGYQGEQEKNLELMRLLEKVELERKIFQK